MVGEKYALCIIIIITIIIRPLDRRKVLSFTRDSRRFNSAPLKVYQWLAHLARKID